MAVSKIYTYTVNGTPFNLERLENEIKASPLPLMLSKPAMYASKVLIEFENVLSTDDETALDAIIAAHDGTLKSRTSQELQIKREAVLSQLVDLAHNHPILKNDEDGITNYLTSIDNWFNAWKRDGNHTVLVAKIIGDAQPGEEHEAFLNTIVDAEGHKTFEFIISYIPTTPYI